MRRNTQRKKQIPCAYSVEETLAIYAERDE